MPKGRDGSWFLPCFETDPEDKDYLKEVGLICVPHVFVSTVRNFPVKYAKLDGFKTKKEMLEVITAIYGHKLKSGDYLSVYKLDRLIRKK